eukprot:4291913-Lingulodinium_polyedra.AAC.1
MVRGLPAPLPGRQVERPPPAGGCEDLWCGQCDVVGPVAPARLGQLAPLHRGRHLTGVRVSIHIVCGVLLLFAGAVR